MDLRSQNSIKRKLDEAFAERNEAGSQRQMAREYRDAAKRVRLKEEFMDRKADKAANHAIVLKSHRDNSVDTIAEKYRHFYEKERER